jgi:putative SOS response-associated peptidase YedK
MCGRYTLRTAPEQLGLPFGIEHVPAITPRFNIAPTQDILTVRDAGDGPAAAMMRWGLIPSWAKDASIGSKMINARADTVAEKPAFRTALKRRRCLIVADGFYEWQKLDAKRKQPWYFTLPEDEPFAFAGLWECWKSPNGPLETATIITTTANDVLAPMHYRMPVILPPETYARWLDPLADGGASIQNLLRPYDGPMEARPVSTQVNSPRNEGPALVEAVTA